MKKKTIVNVLAVAILSFCLFHFIKLNQPVSYEAGFVTSAINETTALSSEEAANVALKIQPDFSKFPTDEAQSIAFSFPKEIEAELSQREQKNQIRDWLIYSIVTNIDLPEQSINKILHDVPIIRYGYNHSVYDLEYGELRSKLLPDNSVVALIPQAGKAEQKDHLAHIADKQRKNLGAIPEKFLVFEYKINPVTKKATLKRLEDVNGDALFGTAYSYHEASVRNLKDLEAFMAQVQDLTFVRQEKDALLLGGRNLISRAYKNIKVEDIAAIWQSENKFPERGTGFSLDPAYDFEGLELLVKKYPKTVATALRASGLISGGNGYSSAYSVQQSEIISLVIKELDKKNPTPIYYVYDYVMKNGVIDVSFNSLYSTDFSYSGTEYFLRTFKACQFQAARYDGDLKGTEVGMILYYTDLLAKMWSMNFEWTTPLKQIPNFVNDPQLKLSKVYAEESDKYNSGRLWFGPNQNGFQLSDDHTLLFARNATKIFSAAKDGMSAEKEVPASALIGKPIYWWNDHYEEVATYEQQYEALNEIMKWSVVIGWLNNKPTNDSNLNYLKNVDVYRKNWFPEWVKEHPQLRFKNWDAVGFYPRGHKGTTTEALPTLYSPSYTQFGIEGMMMTGGVTLARRADIAKIKPITKIKLDKTLFRSNIEANLGKNTFRTIKGTEFKVLNSRLVTQAGKNTRLRNVYTEFSPKPIAKTVRNEVGHARFTSSFDEVPIGNLNVSPSKNGFHVGFQNRSIGQGNHLSKQLSDSRNIQATLRRSNYVDEYVTLQPNQKYLVRLKGNEKWMEIDIAKTPDVELSANWHFRSAGFKADSKIVRQKWISTKEAGEIAQKSGKEWNYGIPERTPPKILDDYASQHYNKVTNEVLNAKNPIDLKKTTKDFFKKELNDIDGILNKGDDFLIAEERLNKLSQYYGNHPEITLRKALLDLQQKLPGNNQQAVNRLNQVANKLKRNHTRFLDEVNHMIANTPTRLANQKTTVNFMNFKAGKSNVLVVEGNALPKGEIVKSPEVLSKLQKNEAILYVQDNPGLNNLNWNTSTNQTLSTVMELHPQAILEKVPKQSISMYQPELAVKMEVSAFGKPQARYYVDLMKARPGVNYINNHCEEEEKNCKDIYTLRLPEYN